MCCRGITFELRKLTPVSRYLEKHLVTHLSRLLIGGTLQANAYVRVKADNGQFKFEIKNQEDANRSRSNSKEAKPAPSKGILPRYMPL